MAAVIAVLGAGPHGRQIAHDRYPAALFDDHLPGYPPCRVGAAEHPWTVGAMWPRIRRQIVVSLPPGRPAHHDGRVFFPGAHIGVETEIGPHVHVLYNAVVSHGCTVGAFTTICSGAVLAGEVTVGHGVFIGANATVIHGGITIGDGATVGAGAVVTHDIPAGATVAGVPARTLQ